MRDVATEPAAAAQALTAAPLWIAGNWRVGLSTRPQRIVHEPLIAPCGVTRARATIMTPTSSSTA